MSETADRIAKLKELEEKATPGPWDAELRYAEILKEHKILFAGDEKDPDTRIDIELTTYLRNNALAIIEELEAENERLKAVHEAARELKAAGDDLIGTKHEDCSRPTCSGCRQDDAMYAMEEALERVSIATSTSKGSVRTSAE